MLNILTRWEGCGVCIAMIFGAAQPGTGPGPADSHCNSACDPAGRFHCPGRQVHPSSTTTNTLSAYGALQPIIRQCEEYVYGRWY